MEGKHTPGPWSAYHGDAASMGDGQQGWVIIADRGIGCHAVVRGEGTHDAANAHLIAAAPELLESLKALVWAFGDAVRADKMQEVWRKPWRDANAAIAKAEGRTDEAGD